MTLDQEYQEYQGQSVLVPGQPESNRGQCAQWSNYVLHDVYGQPYHYGNAIDWWNNPGDLENNFFKVATSNPVIKGDFVIYGAGVGSEFGHIDVAMENGTSADYLGADSNWGHDLTVHQVRHNDKYNQYILGYLRSKGDNMGINQNELALLTSSILDRQPVAGDSGYLGRNWQEVATEFYNSGEHKAIIAQFDKAGALEAQVADLEKQLAAAGGQATVLNPGKYEVKQ